MTGSDASSACGVIVSGLYGSGKSSVVEEIADLLEDAAIPYGALDLDWLWWFGVPRIQRHEALRVLFGNLTFVADAYLDAGVTRFVLAWALRDPSDLAAVRAALPFPVKVVELTVPLPLIEVRLTDAITAGREADLREARRWAQEGLGTGLGDIHVENDRQSEKWRWRSSVGSAGYDKATRLAAVRPTPRPAAPRSNAQPHIASNRKWWISDHKDRFQECGGSAPPRAGRRPPTVTMVLRLMRPICRTSLGRKVSDVAPGGE